MGITTRILKVKKLRAAEQSAEVEFIIDSGAVYSLVPGKVLSALSIEPYPEVTIALADGTKIKRKVGDAYFELNGEGAAAPVIFGEEGDEPLLGVTTLEAIGLVFNPFTRELYPMRMLLVGLKKNQVNV